MFSSRSPVTRSPTEFRLRNFIVTYHETPEGLDLILEDDGIGIPAGRKQQIFEYDAGGHSGIGLFICREILGVTGMTLSEDGNGREGRTVCDPCPQKGVQD